MPFSGNDGQRSNVKMSDMITSLHAIHGGSTHLNQLNQIHRPWGVERVGTEVTLTILMFNHTLEHFLTLGANCLHFLGTRVLPETKLPVRSLFRVSLSLF